MYPIRAGQVKAARALLDWSQDDLAAATGLSATTIGNLESGNMSPRSTTAQIIRRVIEDAGLEFTAQEGIRRRMNGVQIHQDADSCEIFLDDLRQTVKAGDDILIFVKSQAMLLRIFGATSTHFPRQLDGLHAKCLMVEPPDALPVPASFRFKITARQNISPVSCIVYGDKHALVMMDGHNAPWFVVFASPSLAQSWRGHFETLWEQAAAPVVFTAC